ncbi:MAG TPA: SH3 domain-containing protein [Casimicrobiaceae bacterium]|nr:SH3 domain-containing protein [Casimicrobiaceae bacterium]
MARLRSTRALAAVTLALAGCATPPEPEPPPPVPAPTAPQMCPACVDQSQELARLRQDLASRDAEIRELRSSQRDQVKAIQESTREVTRAKAKMRRLATQADAASYIAEVEVALGALRASLPASSPAPLVALAQSLLDSTAAPFAQGDYGAAMDRAAQAEQLIAVVADGRTPPSQRVRVPGEVLLQVTIPLRLVADGALRREPKPSSTAFAKLSKDTPLVAHAYRGSWMRVETPDGRSGWVAQAQLGAR